ncbi:pyruvate kinase alpha/beta domain-containing protein, partial [Rosenbergiella collisarenosi]
SRGYLQTGDLVIVTQGDVMGATGTTNTQRVITVE